MNELLKINYEAEQPTVSARDLHEALGVASRFSRWFDSNKELFVEGEDYNKCTSSTVVNNGASRELEDYSMSVLMAKHICLMSRTEKGKRCRDYLIDLEKAWNTPEQIMARALKMANHSIESLKDRCKFLGEQVVEQQQIITELQPKANYVDMILQSKSLVTITQIAKDYGMSGRKLNKILKELKIQYKVGGQWVLYSKYQNGGYVHSRTTKMKANADQLYEALQILIRETDADALLMNTNMISKVQTMARILGYRTETEEAFGKKVTSLDGVRFMDLKNHYTVTGGTTVTANACVKDGISRTLSGSSATTGLTDIYAVKFDVNDGFHAATITGSSAISQYLPDFNQPGAVKDGEVEMVAATVLKNTKHAGVLRNVKIA